MGRWARGYNYWNRGAERAPQPFVAEAKYAGTCDGCKQKYAVGAKIEFRPRGEGWLKFHSDTCTPEVIETARRARIDMSAENRIYEGRTKQEAWSDESVFTAPIVGGPFTDDELRQALNAYRQSSWGALRWSTYDFVSQEDGRVKIAQHEHLCD